MMTTIVELFNPILHFETFGERIRKIWKKRDISALTSYVKAHQMPVINLDV